MYGLERLKESLHKHGRLNRTEKIFDYVTKDFSHFVGEYVQKDDITMIVIKNTGEDEDSNHIKLTLNVDEERTFQKSKVWDWE